MHDMKTSAVPTEEHLQAMSLGDEWANWLTHGFGAILAFIGLAFLIFFNWQSDSLHKLPIFGIYGATLILVYATSTIYHYLHHRDLKRKFRKFDHCAIYIYIAGCYTPFTLLLMEKSDGLTLFTIVWGMACIGIMHKLFFIHRFKWLSVVFYLSMGWLVVFSADSLFAQLHWNGIYLLVAGGVFYSIGVVFYVLDKRRFFHAIWHLFVLAGSACHYFAILLYV